MTTADNKALARLHLIDVLEQGRVDLIDSYYAPDGSVPEMDTPQQWRDRILWHQKAAPGYRITILDEVAEGDKVAVHFRVDITYVGPPSEDLKFPPEILPILGRPVSWTNTDLMRFAGGKLVASKFLTGWWHMLIRMGAYTVREAAPA